MSKRKRNAKPKLAKILVSVFVLAVALVPVYSTVIWAKGILGTRDPRKVTPVAALQTRAADKTSQPVSPFNEPLVSITFDDGWESVYTEALPTMQQYGFHSTQYVITGTFGSPSYMSVAQLHSMEQAGHDIAGHTISHPDLTILDDQQLFQELGDSQKTLETDFGKPILDFTSPFGSYNAHTLQAIGKYYRSQKNAEGDPAADELEAINIKPTFNPLNFVSYSVRNTTTTKDLQKLLAAAQAHNGWLVLTYHQIDNSNETFSVSPQHFADQMRLLSGSPLRSATVNQVLNQLLPATKKEDK